MIRATVQVPPNFLDVKNLDNKLHKALVDSAREARDFWRDQAGKKYRALRMFYEEGITSRANRRSVTLTLEAIPPTRGYARSEDDKLVLMQELGTPAYPMYMKPGVKPLNVDRVYPFWNARVFRTVPAGGAVWKHPGFKSRAVFPLVEKELTEVILPRNLAAMLEKM